MIHLLEAQAQTLHRLAALFGDDILLHMLEEAGERADAEATKKTALSNRGEERPTKSPLFEPSWFEAPSAKGYSSPYTELESAVHEFKLPSVLEFHLWAYPTYREFVESGLELDARIADGDFGQKLVDEATRRAEEWVNTLSIAQEFVLQAKAAAHVPWLRFRTQTLKRIGKRPLGPVYG